MAALLYFAFKDVDFKTTINWLSKTSIPYLILFIISSFLSHYIRAVRWKYIISSIKPDVSVMHLFGATMIGYGVNSLVPRLGEVYRALFLGKWEGISRTSMFGTVIVERIIDIIALGISVLISVLIYNGDLYEIIPWLESTVNLGFIIMLGLVVFLILLIKLKSKLSNLIIKLLGKISHKAANKLNEVFETLLEGFSTLKGTKNSVMTFIFTVLIMLNYGFSSYIAFYMINMNEITTITFSMAWIVMTISAFGIVIPTPGGTGSYHFINIFVLTIIYGVTQEIAAAYALLTHFITFVLFVSSPFFVLIYINYERKRNGLQTENFISVIKSTGKNK
jgi:uncharacterized protein (TIRG00374 family)